MPVCYAPELGQRDRCDRRGFQRAARSGAQRLRIGPGQFPVEKDLRTFRPIAWVLPSALPSHGDAAAPGVPTTGDTARRVSEGPTNTGRINTSTKRKRVCRLPGCADDTLAGASCLYAFV